MAALPAVGPGQRGVGPPGAGRAAELGPPWLVRGHVRGASADAVVRPSWARLGTVCPRSVAGWGRPCSSAESGAQPASARTRPDHAGTRERSHHSPVVGEGGGSTPAAFRDRGGKLSAPGDSSSDAPEARPASWARRVNTAPGGQRGRPPAPAIPPADTFSTAGICLTISQVQWQMAGVGLSVLAGPCAVLGGEGLSSTLSTVRLCLPPGHPLRTGRSQGTQQHVRLRS